MYRICHLCQTGWNDLNSDLYPIVYQQQTLCIPENKYTTSDLTAELQDYPLTCRAQSASHQDKGVSGANELTPCSGRRPALWQCTVVLFLSGILSVVSCVGTVTNPPQRGYPPGPLSAMFGFISPLPHCAVGRDFLLWCCHLVHVDLPGR